jgi:hypothetical protein
MHVPDSCFFRQCAEHKKKHWLIKLEVYMQTDVSRSYIWENRQKRSNTSYIKLLVLMKFSSTSNTPILGERAMFVARKTYTSAMGYE